MEALPVWKLGAYVAGALGTALLFRLMLEPRVVNRSPLLSKTKRQFQLDMSLFVFAGLLGALIIVIVPGFPFVQSGLKLTLAVITFGLFASLDLALARERDVIGIARTIQGAMHPPRQFASMTRRYSMVAVAVITLVAVVLLLVMFRDIHWLAAQPATEETYSTITRSVLIEILFVMGGLLIMTVNLIVSSARNLRLLFDNETHVLERVSKGDLSTYAPVATNDELGYIAGHTNTMITSLRESMRMRKGLEIAREVQLNFLPSPPDFPGVEVAGQSLYSDETGGDFFDYIHDGNRLVLVVGDVVGHGVGAALLMASCRAYLRQAAADQNRFASDILGAANRQLSRDVAGTGRFVSAFMAVFDIPSETIMWAGAGHPAAMLYTPATDEMRTLSGVDIPLGVDEDWEFKAERLEPSIYERYLVIITDGVTEARINGDMFGEQRLKEAIREHTEESAESMATGIVRTVGRFCPHPDDDVTLVVARIAPTL